MSTDEALELSSNTWLPTVSVIIPIYNGEADLPDLFHCLAQQTYPPTQVEYLLVDNGSSDRTWQMLEAYYASATLQQYRPLRETEIQSSYAARNRGIQAATGEILVFTDADCRPQPDWLYHLVQPFVEPTVGIVAGEIAALPGNSLLERYADRHDVLSQKHTLAHPFHPYGQTANLAIRRAVLPQSGLFRPYLTTGGDADLCWRILQCQNWQIQLAAQAIVLHRHRSTLAELRSQWRRYGRSNRYLHELYGINLMQEMPLKDYLHRWGRWLLKEIPKALLKLGLGNASQPSCIDALTDTPLDLYCRQARLQGQQQAVLPNAARYIPTWSTSVPGSLTQVSD
ncbi:MAG: hypothetical protein Kow00121_66890 [Elainellaceae cyanobacterium]